MRVVLDTNVVMSGLYFGGVPGKILDAWNAGSISLVFSAPVLVEYREVVQELEARYRGLDFESFAALLVVNSEIVDAPSHLPEQVCADPDGDKFLACALSAGCSIVVSGDRALLDVSGWAGIDVLKPRAFFDRYLQG